MTGKCRAVIARTRAGMLQALHSQGFFMVGDLPPKTTIQRRRGMLIVRFP